MANFHCSDVNIFLRFSFETCLSGTKGPSVGPIDPTAWSPTFLLDQTEFKLGTKTVFASLGYGSAFHTGSPYHVLEPAVSYMLNHYRSEKAQLMQRLAETHFHPRTTCADIASSEGTGFGPQDMMGVIYLQGGFCAAALAVFLVSMVMQGCSEKEKTNAAGEPITAENLKESMQAVLRRKSFRMEQEEVSSVTKKEKQEEVSRSVIVTL